jgi:hypothetical protein
VTAALHPVPHPSLTLVVPTISWEEPFGTCIRTSLAVLGPEDEVLVVFDGEPPTPPVWLLQSRATLLSSGRRSGPAAARNHEARRAQGDILLFVDPDVQVHPDAIAGIRARFAAAPELAAVFGCYDDTPADPGLLSRFRNLLHHHTHSSHPGPACTFWAGCGAVRRQAVLDLGGFDAEAYHQPCIEDIEFGLRLHDAGGRILLDPAIKGTHHKRWTLGLIVHNDILQRAIPWSRLLLSRCRLPATLNLSSSARLSAGPSLLMPGALAAAAASRSAPQPWALLVLVGCLGLFLQINRSFLGLVWRQGGLRLAATGTALLTLDLIYSSLSFAGVVLVAGASAAVPMPCWLRERPHLQRRLAWAGLTLVALIAVAATTKGLVLHGLPQGAHDLRQRFDEWRLFHDRIYPARRLADDAARSLPHFRGTVYLPWALPLFGGLFGWGGMGQGQLVITAASLVSLALIAAIGWRTLRPLGRRAGWLGLLIPLAISGNSNCLAHGQFSILCMGLISLQWWLIDRRRPGAAGLCWALAMVKPQIALPFALPLLQRRNRIGLMVGSGLLLALSAVALLHTRTNPVLLTVSWFQVLPHFQGIGNVNALAVLWPLLTNRVAVVVLAALIFALGLGLCWARTRLQSWWAQWGSHSPSGPTFRTDRLELAGLCGIVGLSGFYHLNYDHIMLFPALLAPWRATLQRPRWGNLLITLSMALAVWTPTRMLQAVPNITSIQAVIWCAGGVWLLLRLLTNASNTTSAATAITTELRPAG